MASAKDLHVAPISSADANALVKRLHYSGTVAANSQLHLGVFLEGRCEGVMQFGPSLDKRKVIGLVAGTLWHEFLELNRMAFSERLPRNSESRALGVAFRIIRKAYPQIKWVLSFADGTQCGDGTIYRASGFVLTGIKRNTSIWISPEGETATDIGLRLGSEQKRNERLGVSKTTLTKGANASAANGAASMKRFKEAGYQPLPGFQLRYIKFLDPACEALLTVPVIPFSEIATHGAGMFRGKKKQGGGSSDGAAPAPTGEGGSNPTPPLHSLPEAPHE